MTNRAKLKYGNSEALLEYMLNGKNISILEAILYFGVQSPNRAFTSFKRKGFLIKKKSASMAKIIVRINKNLKCNTPKNLPIKDINMSEYYISK
tara:strand:- start:613 stop:894 length:282 start_codon:yes stop_codon:yes gene_type:complete